MKATKVEGIYDSDPVKDSSARMFETITFTDILKLDLRVMDATAISLCRENNLPILIFNLNRHGNIRRVCLGEKIGSVVTA
jgi:uridylate kinase